jgi:septal ring factor EnvC (AmiA/AmiB activator)
MTMTSISLVMFCGLGLAVAQAAPRDDRPPTRVYTNEDLKRVHPYRNETGVASVPAAPVAGGEDARPDTDSRARARSEAYWRREAARVREKVRALEAQAADVRASLAEREQERQWLVRRRHASGASETTLQARLASLERRRLQLETELEERARRAGALPGWLR